MFNDNDQDGINPPGPVYEWLTAVAAVTQRARRVEVTIRSCMFEEMGVVGFAEANREVIAVFYTSNSHKGSRYHSRAFHELYTRLFLLGGVGNDSHDYLRFRRLKERRAYSKWNFTALRIRISRQRGIVLLGLSLFPENDVLPSPLLSWKEGQPKTIRIRFLKIRRVNDLCFENRSWRVPMANYLSETSVLFF